MDISNRLGFETDGTRTKIDVGDLISLYKSLYNVSDVKLDNATISYMISLLHSVILSVENTTDEDTYITITNKHLKRLYNVMKKSNKKENMQTNPVESVEEIFEDTEEDETN